VRHPSEPPAPEVVNGLKRALVSDLDYISWSARRILLETNDNQFASLRADSRSALLKKNIELVNGEFSHEDYEGFSGLHEIVSADSAIIKDEHVEQLVSFMEEPKWDGADERAVYTLLAASRFRPQLILSLRDRLSKAHGSGLDQIKKAATMHHLTLAVLARANYEIEKGASALSIDSIRALLETRTDSEQRMFGAYEAYLYWLDHPVERTAIETELRSLVGRTEPDLRMAANRALEMIWVGRISLAAPDPIGVPRGLARARLDLLMTHPEEHIASAARLSLERWLDASGPRKGGN